ncbi:MAG: glyoxalase [Candidatus Riflebacteria bacterium HGW-Riflebacteria-2]|jgi:glyoxylase I family protein|nr:MAG: glyoxalase [Candidatus Riflebacteria bacterium HGW-Riflebacteria-2]
MAANKIAPVQFAHVGMTCSNPLETEQFYCRYFGFRRVRTVDLASKQLIFLASADSAFRLELFQATEEAPVPAPGGTGPEWPALKHLAFAVQDLDEFLQQMGAAALITQQTVDLGGIVPGWKAVWLSDPDGRIVEVCQGYADEKSEE